MKITHNRKMLVFVLSLGVMISWDMMGKVQSFSFAECVPKTQEELMQLILNDPSPQIREAASIALSEVLFLENLSMDVLRALATDGEVEELRQAAVKPLGFLFSQANLSLQEMINIASKDPSPQVREAVMQALINEWVKNAFSSADIDRWLLFARDGLTVEVQNAAVDAIFQWLGSVRTQETGSIRGQEIQQLAAGENVTVTVTAPFFIKVDLDGSISALRAGAAREVRRLYLFNTRVLLDEPIEELSKLAVMGTTPELRKAAGLALAEFLRKSDMTFEELKEMAEDGETSELRLAGGTAISLRLVRDYRQEKVNLDDLLMLLEKANSEELKNSVISPLSRLYRCNPSFLI